MAAYEQDQSVPSLGMGEESREINGASRQSRREFLSAAGGMVLATGISMPLARNANAATKTLRILHPNHFVPAFDDWFNNTFIKEWGKQNDTEVEVTNIGMTGIEQRAKIEVERKAGHDICMFLSPPASFEDNVIDHQDIYAECVRRYGMPLDIALKSSFNPVTRKHFGFASSYVPDPINYRKDLWDQVGVVPESWDAIRRGGKLIKDKFGIPVGIGMSNELDSSMAMRSLLIAFGASEQDSNGSPRLKSRNTLEALKFASAFYKETMTEEIFSWDASSNNRQMLAGKGSLTLNAISITRTGENEKIAVADRIHLMKPAKGPEAQLGVMHLMGAYVVWNFSKNIDGAKKFLVDLVGQTRNAFLASRFYNFPTYRQLVPDLDKLIEDDPTANPRNKYAIFRDAHLWTVNVGYPGYANAAVDEVFGQWLLPKMFADTASGRLAPEAALDMYSGEIDRIYKKWRALKKV